MTMWSARQPGCFNSGPLCQGQEQPRGTRPPTTCSCFNSGPLCQGQEQRDGGTNHPASRRLQLGPLVSGAGTGPSRSIPHRAPLASTRAPCVRGRNQDEAPARGQGTVASTRAPCVRGRNPHDAPPDGGDDRQLQPGPLVSGAGTPSRPPRTAPPSACFNSGPLCQGQEPHACLRPVWPPARASTRAPCVRGRNSHLKNTNDRWRLPPWFRAPTRFRPGPTVRHDSTIHFSESYPLLGLRERPR